MKAKAADRSKFNACRKKGFFTWLGISYAIFKRLCRCRRAEIVPLAGIPAFSVFAIAGMALAMKVSNCSAGARSGQ
jgi:hypothetical protein